MAMRCFGDAGFIPVEKYTSSNLSHKEAKALRENEDKERLPKQVEISENKIVLENVQPEAENLEGKVA